MILYEAYVKQALRVLAKKEQVWKQSESPNGQSCHPHPVGANDSVTRSEHCVT